MQVSTAKNTTTELETNLFSANKKGSIRNDAAFLHIPEDLFCNAFQGKQECVVKRHIL